MHSSSKEYSTMNKNAVNTLVISFIAAAITAIAKHQIFALTSSDTPHKFVCMRNRLCVHEHFQEVLGIGPDDVQDRE